MKNILLIPIKLYQYLISPLLGPRCRFSPTCSNYAIEAIQKCPLYKAIPLIFIRILKCHPFHPGGYDPVIKPAEDQHQSCKKH